MNSRLLFPNIEGTEVLFTDEFQEYLLSLHDLLSDRILEARKERIRTVEMVHKNGINVLELPTSEINTTDWQVDSVPDDLKQPGIEISGPAGIASMFINAVNPGPEGERAVGYLDDDEDSGGHSFADTLNSALNRMYSVTGSLRFEDVSRDRVYESEPGPLPFFMHRERGLHLDEADVTIDGNPVSATILSTALTLFHAGGEQINLNQGFYVYLPKLERVEET